MQQYIPGVYDVGSLGGSGTTVDEKCGLVVSAWDGMRSRIQMWSSHSARAGAAGPASSLPTDRASPNTKPSGCNSSCNRSSGHCPSQINRNVPRIRRTCPREIGPNQSNNPINLASDGCSMYHVLQESGALNLDRNDERIRAEVLQDLLES